MRSWKKRVNERLAFLLYIRDAGVIAPAEYLERRNKMLDEEVERLEEKKPEKEWKDRNSLFKFRCADKRALQQGPRAAERLVDTPQSCYRGKSSGMGKRRTRYIYLAVQGDVSVAHFTHDRGIADDERQQG